MKTLTLSTLVLVLALFGVAAQETKTVVKEPQAAAQDWKIPPEAAKKENPVKPTESSVADGKKLYGYQCAMCHGEKGDGKGDLADSMKLTLKDYADPEALKEWTDGMLFYVIEKGKGKMPGQEGRMKDEQVWNMVNYVRSLAKKAAKEADAKPKPEKP
jgi:mono/diheme cytochrome c family protein